MRERRLLGRSDEETDDRVFVGALGLANLENEGVERLFQFQKRLCGPVRHRLNLKLGRVDLSA